MNQQLRHSLRTMGRAGRMVCAWLCFALLTPFAVLAGGLEHPVLTVTRGTQPIPLESHAWILEDPTGALEPAQLVAGPALDAFRPLGRTMNKGFTASAIWLKLNLTAVAEDEWWLQIDQPILEDVRLYALQANGQWTVHMAHGLGSGPHELNTRKPTFTLNLGPGQVQTVLLRIQSRTSVSGGLTLWNPKELASRNAAESFAWGLVFGAYLLVIVFFALFTLWARERAYAAYTGLIFINFMAASLTDCWNFELGLILQPLQQTTWLGVFVSLSPVFTIIFTALYLKTFSTWPKTTRIYLGVTGLVSFIGVALALGMRYRESAILVQSFSILMVLLNTSLLGYLSAKGNKRAQLLLWAFSIFHITVAWRYLRNVGYIEPTVLNGHAYQIGAFMHMLILSSGIFSNYRKIRQESGVQQARAEAESNLRRRQTEFLKMVSHEVKTPLSVITASADNLQLTPGLPESAVGRIEKIVRNTGKIQDIFQNYLENEQILSSDSPFQFREINVCTFCRNLAQEFMDSGTSAIHVETPPSGWVRADSRLLSIAITNLLSNAQKYTPDGSSIRLEVRQEPGFTAIAVHDDGPGMDDEDLPYIFQPYYRGRNAGSTSGSGLGLHLVRYIAHQHGGEVSALRREDKGMTFEIMLPKPGL